MAAATQWTVMVDAETDKDVREILAEEGGEQNLSRFVEAAVKERIFHMSVAKAKAANAVLSEEDIQTVIDEAVAWARKR